MDIPKNATVNSLEIDLVLMEGFMAMIQQVLLEKPLIVEEVLGGFSKELLESIGNSSDPLKKLREEDRKFVMNYAQFTFCISCCHMLEPFLPVITSMLESKSK